MFFRSDRAMAMKSVPPEVARTSRHRLREKPLIMPPKTHTSRMSSVMSMEGIRSVKKLVSTMDRQEYRVNFFPMSLKLMMAGMALNIRLMGEKGSSTSR